MHSSDRKTRLITALALLLVLIFAVFVRSPSYYEAGADGGAVRTAFGCPEVCTDKNGSPFFINMDGYYHVRIGDDLIKKGRFGDPLPDSRDPEDLWDMLRRAPEGRHDKYHDGMVRAAVCTWKLVNVLSGGRVSPHTVFFWFSVLCSLLTAVMAFILAKRAADAGGASGNVSGVAAALLVSCAPAFVQRTLAGTFDTDMIQLLFTIVLMILITEALKADSAVKSLLFAAGFGAVAAVFTKFWGAYSFAFALIGIIGGIIYVMCSFIKRLFGGKGRLRWFIRFKPLYAVIVAIAFTLGFATALYGPSYLGSFAGSFRSTATKTSTDDLPHMFVSISEMQEASFGPSKPADWILGDICKSGLNTVSGSGGILIIIAAAAALIVLVFRMSAELKKNAAASDSPEHRESSAAAIYLSVLGVWFALCFYGTTLGVRFIEHFNAPVGILAGLSIGFLRKAASSGGSDILIKHAIVCLISASVILPCAAGSVKLFPNSWGPVTIAQENAMDMIADDSATEDSVIASWWDLGYYYESASGHPTLMDGGELDPVRAMIIGKAFTCEEPALSRALLSMLSTSGNRCIDELREKLENRDAFAALWKLAAADRDNTVSALEGYGFDRSKAGEIESLMHPAQPRETYVVVTTRMIQIVRWMKYFAEWDFTDLSKDISSVGNVSDSAVISRLYAEESSAGSDAADLGEYFDRACSYDDGAGKVVVWKLK